MKNILATKSEKMRVFEFIQDDVLDGAVRTDDAELFVSWLDTLGNNRESILDKLKRAYVFEEVKRGAHTEMEYCVEYTHVARSLMSGLFANNAYNCFHALATYRDYNVNYGLMHKLNQTFGCSFGKKPVKLEGSFSFIDYIAISNDNVMENWFAASKIGWSNFLKQMMSFLSDENVTIWRGLEGMIHASFHRNSNVLVMAYKAKIVSKEDVILILDNPVNIESGKINPFTRSEVERLILLEEHTGRERGREVAL